MHLVFLIILVAFFGLLGVGGTVLWIWAIVDCIQNKRLNDNEKILWVLLVIFTHFVGAVIYFAAGRSANRTAAPYPYAGQQQPAQYPYAAPGQQQPAQYQQPSTPMYQGQQGAYNEIPQAHYPEPYPPQD